jgi:hypothetical protein
MGACVLGTQIEWKRRRLPGEVESERVRALFLQFLLKRDTGFYARTGQKKS